MNLNPEDGHIMDYSTGWRSDTSIGTDEEALRKDYKDQTVWEEPANYISISLLSDIRTAQLMRLKSSSSLLEESLYLKDLTVV